jgi:hypothetical protein
VVSPVFKTAWARASPPEGSTPFLLRQFNEISSFGGFVSRSMGPSRPSFRNFANGLLTRRFGRSSRLACSEPDG